MRRWLLVVAVVGVVGIVGTSCATQVSSAPTLLPTTALEGWTTIARTWSPGETPPQVDVSPNGRFVAYETAATIPPDTDPYPNERNLYVLDRDTGIHHMIRPWLARADEVRDDGAVLVSYRDSAVGPLQTGVFTPGAGITPLTLPTTPSGCRRLLFESDGPGFQLHCDGTDTQDLGLYRFDAGDVTGTPVAVVAGLPVDRRRLVSVSPNHRYFEISPQTEERRWVHDSATGTTFPFSFESHSTLPWLNTASEIRFDPYHPPVADDGRLMFHQTVWTFDMEGSREMWFDPRDGSETRINGFPPLSPAAYFEGTNLFAYEDFTLEIGRHYFLEGRQPQTLPILGDVTSPSTRWLLPFGTEHLLAVAPDGDLIMTSPATTLPGEEDPGVDIIVREGPLP